MSKMGRYVETQIEKGNYTVDERGTYRVGFEDRKECPPAHQATGDSLQQDEGEGQRGRATDQAE